MILPLLSPTVKYSCLVMLFLTVSCIYLWLFLPFTSFTECYHARCVVLIDSLNITLSVVCLLSPSMNHYLIQITQQPEYREAFCDRTPGLDWLKVGKHNQKVMKVENEVLRKDYDDLRRKICANEQKMEVFKIR